MSQFRLRPWMVGLPAFVCAAWVGWAAYSSIPGSTAEMTIARVQQLQSMADNSCECAQSSKPNSEKHSQCWSKFQAAVEPLQKIEGPQWIAACEGWDADNTITFGPPVVEELKRQTMRERFDERIAAKYGYVDENGFNVVPEVKIPKHLEDPGEMSMVAPRWTVTVRRVHGGCTKAEETKLVEAKTIERRIAAADNNPTGAPCG